MICSLYIIWTKTAPKFDSLWVEVKISVGSKSYLELHEPVLINQTHTDLYLRNSRLLISLKLAASRFVWYCFFFF